MKPKLDPREAPKGYRARYARGAYTCAGCAGAGRENVDLCEWLQSEVPCRADVRKDKCHARYVEIVKAPKRPSAKATFARHLAKESYDFPWLNHVHKDAFAKLTVRLMRRAWNAGRRAAKKERN